MPTLAPGPSRVDSSQVQPSSKLRVVVWNMAHKRSVWAALDRLEPDIALLNEAVVPDGRTGVWNPEGTRGRDGGVRRWTAAVLSELPCTAITDARPQWRQIKRNVNFECSRPGSWAAASVQTAVGPVTAVSLYGLLDELSDASVHRSLSEISPLLDDPRYKRHVLIGGDLNSGTQWPSDESFYARDRNLLDRFAALGLVDCLRRARPKGRLNSCPCTAGDDCCHVHTRRDPRRPTVAYQTDYLFASSRLAARLMSCEALATDEWFKLSDHAPIVAEFHV